MYTKHKDSFDLRFTGCLTFVNDVKMTDRLNFSVIYQLAKRKVKSGKEATSSVWRNIQILKNSKQLHATILV